MLSILSLHNGSVNLIHSQSIASKWLSTDVRDLIIAPYCKWKGASVYKYVSGISDSALVFESTPGYLYVHGQLSYSPYGQYRDIPQRT